MRILLVLPLLFIAFSGCLGGDGTDQGPTTTETTSPPGRPIGGLSGPAEEPMAENATRRVMENSFGLISSGSEFGGVASLSLNAQTCVTVGDNLRVWQPLRLNVTATWSPRTPAAEQMMLTADTGTSRDTVTGTSPLHLQVEGFDPTDEPLRLFVDEADNTVTVEQEITLDVRLEYEATASAEARADC